MWPTLMQSWIFRMRSSLRCAQVLMNSLVNWSVEKKVSELFGIPMCQPLPLLRRHPWSRHSHSSTSPRDSPLHVPLALCFSNSACWYHLCFSPHPIQEHEIKYLCYYKILKKSFLNKLDLLFFSKTILSMLVVHNYATQVLASMLLHSDLDIGRLGRHLF